MNNYVERTKKSIAVNAVKKRVNARNKISITLDENKQVTWFLDYVRYEIEKKKYTKDFIERLRNMPYKRYLLTPHWERVKKSAYGRFGKVCFSCSKTRKIEVHHLSYKNRGCENMEDLMLLCEDCHEMVHETMLQCEESKKTYENNYTD
jgi:5-methylcytosine-specific restriction endonuclease McrA